VGGIKSTHCHKGTWSKFVLHDLEQRRKIEGESGELLFPAWGEIVLCSLKSSSSCMVNDIEISIYWRFTLKSSIQWRLFCSHWITNRLVPFALISYGLKVQTFQLVQCWLFLFFFISFLVCLNIMVLHGSIKYTYYEK
jgi:hypothetical protein